MHRLLLPTITVALLGMCLSAQVPPGIASVDMTRTPWRPPVQAELHPLQAVFANGNNVWSSATSTQHTQLELRPSGVAGLFRYAGTVANATSTSLGGAGGFDVVEGTFDERVSPSKWTLGNLAASFNTSGDEFSFSISADGLFAVCDRPGQAVFATRASTAASWGPVAPLSGTPRGYIDSKLVELDNTTYYAFANGIGISMGVVDRNTGTVSGITPVVSSIPGAVFAHSPHPVTVGGNLEGWLVAGFMGSGDSDSYFVPGRTDGVNAAQLIYNNTSWQSNPTAVGDSGSFYWAWNAARPNNYQAPLVLDTVAIAGGRVVPGPHTIHAWVPHTGTPWLGVFVLGINGPATLPIARTVGNAIGSGVGPRPPGQFGLFPTPIADFGTSGTDNLALPVIVPANFPIGVPLGLQFAAIDVSQPGARVVIGNTASVMR